MFVRTLFLVGRMDEGVEIAELELDGGFETMPTSDIPHRLYDLLAVLDGALMVVGHLEYKKVREIELFRWARVHTKYREWEHYILFQKYLQRPLFRSTLRAVAAQKAAFIVQQQQGGSGDPIAKATLHHA
jgi:hypothetical protein